MSDENRRHRLRQKDLVSFILVLFSEEYERNEAASITSLEIPLAVVREQLESRTGILYSGDAWIVTQIHKYEEEMGFRLFRKRGAGPPVLGLDQNIRTYAQKRHLYVTQKIRAANGVFDLVRNEEANRRPERPLRLLLEAGSTLTRVAEIIAQNLPGLPWRLEICTHNLGIMEALGGTGPDFERVRMDVPRGRFDPCTNLILGGNLELYGTREFDWIVQGASFLSGTALGVESREEAEVKSGILRECRGRKVLVLTGHEATDRMPEGAAPFGSVADYDYIVHPAFRDGSAISRRLANELESGAVAPAVMIRNWSYVILERRTHTSGEAPSRRN